MSLLFDLFLVSAKTVISQEQYLNIRKIVFHYVLTSSSNFAVLFEGFKSGFFNSFIFTSDLSGAYWSNPQPRAPELCVRVTSLYAIHAPGSRKGRESGMLIIAKL